MEEAAGPSKDVCDDQENPSLEVAMGRYHIKGLEGMKGQDIECGNRDCVI